jgi:hypothetical protein
VDANVAEIFAEADGDVAEALRWIAPAAPPAKIRVRRVWPLWAAMGAALGIAIAAFAFWVSRTKTPEPPELRNRTFSGHDHSPTGHESSVTPQG